MPFAEKLSNRGQLYEEQRQAEARKAALKRQQAKAQKKKEQVKNANGTETRDVKRSVTGGAR